MHSTSWSEDVFESLLSGDAIRLKEAIKFNPNVGNLFSGLLFSVLILGDIYVFND